MASEISQDEFARAEKLPAVKVMLLPSLPGKRAASSAKASVAGFPFTSTSRTLPLPREQADCNLAEKSEKDACESDVSRRNCEAAARREEAA